MSNNNVPKLRFPGFSDAWEQRKVKELCSISTGKSNTQDKVDDGEYPFYVRSPIIERSTKYLYDEEAVLTVGDGVGTGKVFHYVNGKYDLHQRCYRMYDFKDELNALYFYHTFSLLFYNRVMAMTAKTSVDSVRMEMIADMEIPVPNIDEQEKIGAFFTNIDNLITLQQRKCDEYKSLKKCLLQKMFPKDGEQFPEIRFPGFNDAWEQRKLSEVSEIIGGGTPSTTNPEYWDGDINWYAPAEIGDQIYIECSERKITKLGLEKSSAKILPAYKTVLFTSRAGIGKTAILSTPGATNQGFQSMVINDNNNPYFVFSMTGFIKEKAERVAAGSTFAEISGKMLGNLEFLFPEKDEQKQIGCFFEKIDNLITLQQRKCDEMKELKKALLQHMFV